MVREAFVSHRIACSMMLILTLGSASAAASDTLFVDDFSLGRLESNWMLFGDPQSKIIDSLGIQPPCFDNNGDSMWSSGAVSRKTFSTENGLVIQCDMYLSCDERGTWVTACLKVVTPGFSGERTGDDYGLAAITLAYNGELSWQRPDLQTTLRFSYPSGRLPGYSELYRRNCLLDGWHRYRIEIVPDEPVNYFIDDSLCFTSPDVFPEEQKEVRVALGNRSVTDWGIALHDNIIVYAP